jgi:hypothetical protein
MSTPHQPVVRGKVSGKVIPPPPPPGTRGSVSSTVSGSDAQSVASTLASSLIPQSTSPPSGAPSVPVRPPSVPARPKKPAVCSADYQTMRINR